MIWRKGPTDNRQLSSHLFYEVLRSQIAKYGASSALVVITNFVIYASLIGLGVRYPIASIVGSFVGIGLAFMLQSRHVFEKRSPIPASFLRHLVVYAFQIMFSLFLLMLLVEAFGSSLIAAYLIATPIVSTLTFLAQKKWTFQN